MAQQAGPAWVLANFTWSKVVASLIDVLLKKASC